MANRSYYIEIKCQKVRQLHTIAIKFFIFFENWQKHFFDT